jgi:hypothetical protein
MEHNPRVIGFKLQVCWHFDRKTGAVMIGDEERTRNPVNT